MKIELNWLEPIELGSSSTLRENIKNLDLKCIPDIAGVYIFFYRWSPAYGECAVPKFSLLARRRWFALFGD